MLLGIAFLILQILFGLSIFSYFDPKNKFSLWEFFLCGSAAGILIGVFLVLALSLVTESLNLALIYFCAIAVLVIILRFSDIKRLFMPAVREAEIIEKTNQIGKIKKHLQPWIFIIAIIILIYIMMIGTVLFRDETGSLKSALVGWGDSALHIGLIERFATADPFELTHPLLGGANLTYPFLIDFISGIFLKLGGELIFAFSLPLYVLGVLWMLIIFSFASRILKSKLFASIAVVLIMLGSGLGFTVLYNDLKQGYETKGIEGVLTVINNPPHEYTHLNDRTGGIPKEKETKDNIVWIVPLISFFAHQRSFTLGLTIFAVLLLGIFHYGAEKTFWRFGIFAGLLPFSHGHTFIAIFLLMVALFPFFIKNWKSWSLFALSTSVLALPQINYFSSSSKLVNISSFKPYFGWMTCEHNSNWFYCDTLAQLDSNAFIFWSKNFGLIFLLWVAILIAVFLVCFLPHFRTRIKHNFNLKFLFASLFLFVVPNLILFQPWSFDNNKVLFYWWLLAIIFVVVPALKLLWDRSLISKAIVVVLIFFSILAGSVDSFARISSPRNIGFYGYADGSKDNRDIADWIKSFTKPNDLFLADSNIDPVPLFLAGRPVYIAFEGWLWSEGLDYSRNHTNITKILEGDVELACSENIKYILLNDGLKRSFQVTSDTALISKTKIVYTKDVPSNKTSILEVTCPAG